MFFVPVGGGCVQALRADTLESVWVSESLGGQTITPITYYDGKVYCGTWNSESAEGKYFCISAEDEDTNKKTEVKECLWTVENIGGFYWAGAYATENYVIFGSDDGESEGTNGESVLYSVNPESGEIIDTIEGISGDIRSGISYDEETDRIYFTTKGGMLCKTAVNADGTFADDTFETYDLGGASTVTPLVYDGLAYIGVTNAAQFENGGYGYKVIDVNVSPMKEVASAEVPGGVQSCALMTTAYENTGWVYVYITYNNIPGGIYELALKKTDETDEDGAAVVTLNAKELFVPEEPMAQYCICSPICDEDGTIYYKNDSGYLMAVRRRVSSGTSSGGSSGGGGGSGAVVEEKEETPEKEPETVPEEEKQETTVVSKFEDTKGHWAEEYINVLSERGLINGKTETEFAPDDKVTRAEFVSLLYRLSGDETVFCEKFNDVKADDWYSIAVSWAVEKGITSGTSADSFSPDETITREMAVVFIARYLGYKETKISYDGSPDFADNEMISEWALTSVAAIKNVGIISGKENNVFAPLDSATRGETAKILVNMIGVMKLNEK